MQPREPKAEVFDACKVVLRHMSSDFPGLMLKAIKEGSLTPETIIEQLQAHEYGRAISDSEAGLMGFQSSNPAYGLRLMKEWEGFFKAYAAGELIRII